MVMLTQPTPPVDLNRSLGWNLSRRGMEITQRIWDGPDCYNWREVFAWLPCQTISGKRVWLRKIYKRRFWVVWGTGFHMEPHVEYGTLFDMITHE
jgi:hypothetical protein